MTPNQEALRSFPSVIHYLTHENWRTEFSKATLGRAKEYTHDHRLLAFKIFDDEGDLDVTASFRGNHGVDYESDIFITKNRKLSIANHSYCNCPVSSSCKHVAALAMLLEKEAFKILSQDSPHLASDYNKREVTQWLASLEASSSTKPDLLSKNTSGKANPTFLIYCLTKHVFNSGHTLQLKTARYLKNGSLKINLETNPTADPRNPPKYMSSEDVPLCALYHQSFQRYYTSNGLEMNGLQAALLREQIFEKASERFFYLDENNEAHLLHKGEPLEPEPIWDTDVTSGSTRPNFAPPLKDALEIVFREPPYALVTNQDGEFYLHSIETKKHSLTFLKAWSEGPLLQPEQLGETVAQLNKSPTKLPPLSAPKTKRLSTSTPEVHLHLHRKNPFQHRGHHLSGKPEPVIAEISFHYHDHPFAPDLAVEPSKKETFHLLKDGLNLIIPRNSKKEKEAILHLVRDWGLMPASVIDYQVEHAHRSAFLPNEEIPYWEVFMAQFIEEAVPKLRDIGWVVEIDSSAEFKIHRVTSQDIETGLEESETEGIDWFHFSASFLTPSGDQQSILPLLSQYLQHLDFDTIDQTIAETSEEDSTLLSNAEDPTSFISLPTLKLLTLAKTLHDLFGFQSPDTPLHRLQAASLADSLELDSSKTLKALAQLGKTLKETCNLPRPKPPASLQAELRDYQLDGFHWMQFLARHSLNGILADDMGLGKTVQTLAHLQAEVSGRRTKKRPSLVIAPTSVTSNWINEAAKFTPKLKTLLLQGPERKERFQDIDSHHLIITSYALLVRDFEILKEQHFHLIVLDEAQYIKNANAKVSRLVCQIESEHRVALSGTPLENHLGELWSQMRFLMPGLLGSSEAFRKNFRTPIEKHQETSAQTLLNSRVAPLILRRTKDQVATELPPKTEILHSIKLNAKQVDLYETVRAAMDHRIKDAIADKGLAKSQIVVLDALLKLRQICCHPQLLKLPAAKKVKDSAKLHFLTDELLPTMLEEGRRILIFSSFTTMLGLIEKHLKSNKIPFAKITGNTKDRAREVERFQEGTVPVFLISLKAGGTGLNLTAADTVIHYDPWWNPAAENQATDRAYRIGQDKPVFVHKLISKGTIEERIVELQVQKAKLVDALLSEKTTQLKIDQETLGNLLAPLNE